MIVIDLLICRCLIYMTASYQLIITAQNCVHQRGNISMFFNIWIKYRPTAATNPPLE